MSLLDPAVQNDPFDFYALLHEHRPIYQIPETGVFVVSRFDEVKAVLLDHETFSSRFGESFLELQGAEQQELYARILREEGWPHSLSLQNADPPLHTKHRKLIEFAFSRKNVLAMADEIDEVCHDLIDGFAADGCCEFVSQFAMPLPGILIAKLIGLSADQLPLFKRWADALLAPITHVMSVEETAETARAEVELQHFLADMREERRKNPTGDIISVLASQPANDGAVLPMIEYQYVLRQLIAGGFETTMNAISHAMWLLMRHTDQLEKLRSDMSLMSKFIDEVVRFDAPVQGLLRRATRATEIAGTTIPENAIVMVRYGAANRDPQQFACPHRFDIERRNVATHVGFGNGIHFCIGRTLARQEMHSAFTALLLRLDNIRIARPLPQPPHSPSLLFRPFREMHLRFDVIAQRPPRQ
ncbi:cytochrome P450 [Sphingobium cloacae]|uniref:Cytochrome P450 n=2 Tax=Sphingobium cloacae TaxID=120107 RepID=A0A1E1F6Y0_9SPHN|nr:cytochrome P450 [Sphingobium cloacae]